MRMPKFALLAGVGAAVLVAASQIAQARDEAVHVLTVQLPGGGTEQVRYWGDVPPRVVILPGGLSGAPLGAVPVAEMAAPFGWQSPFAMMDRIAAEMDQQAAAMMRAVESEAAAVPAGPGDAQGYGYVARFTGNGVCMQTTTITSQPGQARPQVVSQVSGDCGDTPVPRNPALRAPHVVRAQAPTEAPAPTLRPGAGPNSNLVRHIAAWE